MHGVVHALWPNNTVRRNHLNIMTITSILIPLVGGILLVAFPQIFTESTGDVLNRAKGRLRTIGFLLIGVAVIFSVVKAGESLAQRDTAAKPQMEMHRLQATTRGDSGWYLAESTHGSFSVLIPIPFNDFTVTESDPKWGTVQTHMVGALSAEGLKFSATETPIIPGRSPRDLDQMEQTLARGDKGVSDVVKAPFSGWPSLSLSQAGPESGAYIRCVQTDTSYIMVILEYPTARRLDAAQLKSQFLDSLKIKSPNKPHAANSRRPGQNGFVSLRVATVADAGH